MQSRSIFADFCVAGFTGIKGNGSKRKLDRKRMKTPFRLVVGTLLALATTVAWPAFADDYPNKPIKVISDSAPGSAIDAAFRMVMDRLGTVRGRQRR